MRFAHAWLLCVFCMAFWHAFGAMLLCDAMVVPTCIIFVHFCFAVFA